MTGLRFVPSFHGKTLVMWFPAPGYTPADVGRWETAYWDVWIEKMAHHLVREALEHLRETE